MFSRPSPHHPSCRSPLRGPPSGAQKYWAVRRNPPSAGSGRLSRIVNLNPQCANRDKPLLFEIRVGTTPCSLAGTCHVPTRRDQEAQYETKLPYREAPACGREASQCFRKLPVVFSADSRPYRLIPGRTQFDQLTDTPSGSAPLLPVTHADTPA